MIQSMTGFGKEVVHLPSKTISIEIKSLNSKGLDLSMRLPNAYREKEIELREIIAKSLDRGKIDCIITIEAIGEATSTQVNEALVKQYIRQLANVVNGDPVELLKMAVRMPDALKMAKEELDEGEFIQVTSALEKALKAINDYRSQEGDVLEKDFVFRITEIGKLLDEVAKLDGERIGAVRERLRKAVSDLKEQVDENRFEQELIFYLEKYDITEEKTRLKAHLDYFLDTLKDPESNGKKLGFIIQEIGREINTIGSKANHAAIQQLVVRMKDQLEKMKEQSMNIL
ncbi:MAG TPA: YicC/YloC family endoribonuclease [Flavobacteriaceae bacterium]|nr:YicC/YloC family endoribonuclease [Flavobacteriaceae bacterium]